MLDYTRTEIIAGIFVVGGLLALAYLSISIGGLKIMPAHTYEVSARFSNIGDLKVRAPIKVAGVTVGQVRRIRLADYYAEVEMAVDRALVLPEDTIASISTAGLLGESYVSLSPGAADRNLPPEGRITHTEPAVNVVDLISKYAFGGAGSGGTSGSSGSSNHASPRSNAPPAASPQKRKEPSP
jgi:phospholipid/cholesterol/gamma-HCH transport system substrate-binding protein